MEKRVVRAALGPLDLQASLDRADNLDSTATLDPLDPRAWRAVLVSQDLRAMVAPRAAMGSKGQEVFPDQLETLEVVAPQELGVRPDHRVPSESQEHQEAEGCLDPMDQWDPRDSPGAKVRRGMRDPKESLATWAGLGLPVCRDSGVPPAGGDQEELPDPWASPETTGRTERPGSQDCRECPAGPGPWEHPATRGSLENREQKVRRVFPGPRGPEEMLARMV